MGVLRAPVALFPGRKRPLFRPEAERRTNGGRQADLEAANGHGPAGKADTAIQGCILFQLCIRLT
jgi:hypothetical protein